MSNELLAGRLDRTLVAMYAEDAKCENANQQIYNAILYEFFTLRILAAEMDQKGRYTEAIADILQKSIDFEKKAENIFMQVCNVRYAVFEMLEILAYLSDTAGTHRDQIQSIHSAFQQNDNRAENINQQIYFAADASCAMLSLIAEIFDQGGRYAKILNDVVDDYQESNRKCDGIFQQTYCADRMAYQTLQILSALFGGQGANVLSHCIEDNLNENYKISKGIFHDILFLKQASVELLAFCTLGYAGEELAGYRLPNWKGAADANRETTEMTTAKPIPKKAPAPKESAEESTPPAPPEPKGTVDTLIPPPQKSPVTAAQAPKPTVNAKPQPDPTPKPRPKPRPKPVSKPVPKPIDKEARELAKRVDEKKVAELTFEKTVIEAALLETTKSRSTRGLTVWVLLSIAAFAIPLFMFIKSAPWTSSGMTLLFAFVVFLTLLLPRIKRIQKSETARENAEELLRELLRVATLELEAARECRTVGNSERVLRLSFAPIDSKTVCVHCAFRDEHGKCKYMRGGTFAASCDYFVSEHATSAFREVNALLDRVRSAYKAQTEN